MSTTITVRPVEGTTDLHHRYPRVVSAEVTVTHPRRPGEHVELRVNGERIGLYPTREAAWREADEIRAIGGDAALLRRAR